MLKQLRYSFCVSAVIIAIEILYIIEVNYIPLGSLHRLYRQRMRFPIVNLSRHFYFFARTNALSETIY